MNPGKDICKMLKSIRKRIAEQYGLNYRSVECNHKGDCGGTCPACDAELKDLQVQLEAKGISKVEFDVCINAEINKFRDEYLRRLEERHPDDTQDVLEGMPVLPKDIFPSRIPAIESNMRNYPLIDLSKQRIRYKKCFVAGIGFHDIDEIWDELYVGAKLALVRDKGNKHDKNAVAVALADDYEGDSDDCDCILGYIPCT